MKNPLITAICLSAVMLGACSKTPEADGASAVNDHAPPVQAASESPAASLPTETVVAAPVAEKDATPEPPTATAAPANAAAATNDSGAVETPAATAAPVAAAGGDVIKGWKAWRAAACERCHGAEQQGMVGPSLIVSMGKLTKEEFVKTVLEGRLALGMPSHAFLAPKIDDLYAYLKGRSDGSIPNVRPDGA
jgi:hypothetical protein